MLCFERQTDRSFFSSFFFTFFPVFLSFLVLIVDCRNLLYVLFVCVAKIAINGVLFRIRWLRVVFVIFANFLILLNLFLFLFYFFLAFYCLCFAFSLPILYSTLSTICFYSDGRTRPTLLNAPIAIVTYAML